MYSVVYSRNFSRYLIFNIFSSNVVVYMLLLRALYRYSIIRCNCLLLYCLSWSAEIFPRILYSGHVPDASFIIPDAACFVIEMALQHISSHDKPKAQAVCHMP